MAATPLATKFEQSLGLNWLFSQRGAILPPKQITIVALSSGAAERMALSKYSGNWPRTVHANLVQRLCKAGSRLTVFDIAFKEAHASEEDAAFEQALSQCPKVVLFTYLKREQIFSGSSLVDIEQEIPPLERFNKYSLAAGSFTLPKYPAQVVGTPIVTRVSGALRATQPLLAFLALMHDDDLQAILDASKTSKVLPAELEERAQVLIQQAARVDKSVLSPHQQRIVELLSARGEFHINFYGPSMTVKTWSIDEVLTMDPNALTQEFSNKVVYIGYSDSRQTEQQDAYRTVFSNALGLDLSGVEISATIFANMLHRQEVIAPSAGLKVFMTIVFVGIVYLSSQFVPLVSFTLQTSAVAVYGLLSVYLFAEKYLWLPLVLPALTVLLINAWVITAAYTRRKFRIQEVQYALGQYLPPAAAKTLSKSVANLESQRRLVQGVCLMTDIQGYTRLSETMEPAELHQLMNEYYAVLVSVIEKHQGFIANFVGDAMLALWTGGEINESMCQKAYAAAIELQQRIADDPKLSQKLPTCVALHGGQFSLGNLGAKGHYEYSPVGDIINTVSRVEHFNRDLGTQFLCTEIIAKNLTLKNGMPELIAMGDHVFRNKTEPMTLYTTDTLKTN